MKKIYDIELRSKTAFYIYPEEGRYNTNSHLFDVKVIVEFFEPGKLSNATLEIEGEENCGHFEGYEIPSLDCRDYWCSNNFIYRRTSDITATLKLPNNIKELILWGCEKESIVIKNAKCKNTGLLICDWYQIMLDNSEFAEIKFNDLYIKNEKTKITNSYINRLSFNNSYDCSNFIIKSSSIDDINNISGGVFIDNSIIPHIDSKILDILYLKDSSIGNIDFGVGDLMLNNCTFLESGKVIHSTEGDITLENIDNCRKKFLSNSFLIKNNDNEIYGESEKGKVKVIK